MPTSPGGGQLVVGPPSVIPASLSSFWPPPTRLSGPPPVIPASPFRLSGESRNPRRPPGVCMYARELAYRHAGRSPFRYSHPLPAFAGKTRGALLRLPGESRGPRPWGLVGGVVSGFRRNDGWGGESRGPRPRGLGGGVVLNCDSFDLVAARAWEGDAGGGASGFRRNDGGGAKAGVHVPSTLRVSQCGVDALSPGVGGAWFPAFAGMTGGWGVKDGWAAVPTQSPRRKPGSTSPGVGADHCPLTIVHW